MFFAKYVKLCNNYVHPDGKLGISPSAAAEAMGFKRSQVTRWKTIDQPRMSTLLKMVDFFGCTLDDLIEKQPIENDGLSEDEKDLIQLFRSVSPATRLAMLHLLRVAEAQESNQDADAEDK